MEMESFPRKRFLNLSFQFGIFIFPVLGGFVKDAGSIVYVLLAIISLFYLRDVPNKLEKIEKLIFIGFISYFLFASLTIFFAVEIKPSLSQLDRSMRFLAFVPLYLAVRKNNISLSKPFLNGLVFAGIALSFASVVSVDFLGNNRAQGGYHVNVFALYCAEIAVVLVSAVLMGKFIFKTKQIYFLGIVGALISSYLTETRSSWLAIVVGVLVILAMVFKDNRDLAAKWLLGFIAVIVLSLVVVPGVKERVDKAIVEAKLYQSDKSQAEYTSIGTRFALWEAAYDMSKKSYFLGVGVGNYETVLKKEYVATGKIPESISKGGGHSIYFQALAEIGIIGLIVMIVGIFLIPSYVLLNSVKSINSWYVASGLATLAVFAVVGFTENWTGRNPMINLYVVSLLVIFTGVFQTLDKESDKRKTLIE